MSQLILPESIRNLSAVLAKQHLSCIVVGGCVRDGLLNLPVKDIDIEVYGAANFESLATQLQAFGPVNEVGKSFGVLKLTLEGLEIDFSLPRTESKIGPGHTGFSVTHSGDLNFKEAASRRDFTLNALGYDIQKDLILDPFNGLSDLKKGVLRHVSEAFSEDPLRVLRGVQFAARFEFEMAAETKELCKTLDLSELARERLFEEFKKLLLKSKRPSIGFKLARELGVLRYFPELEALIECPQDPKWHPEGDVWVHTLMVVDEMVALKTGDEKRDLILLLGALCHDFGKPATTVKREGRWTSRNHEARGEEPTRTFLQRLTDEKDMTEQVVSLVKEHLKPAMLYNDSQTGRVSDGAIRRLAMRVNIADLILVSKADQFGRTTPDALAKNYPAGQWLLNRAKALNVKYAKPEPLLLGRHVMALGVPAGPEMGAILKVAFEAQLDGAFETVEDGIEYLKGSGPYA